MASRTENQGLFPEAVFKFDHLGNHVQSHLKKVYGALSIAMLAATAGAYVHLFTNFMQAGILTSLASLGLMLWLAMTHHAKETESKRLMIFSGFAFFTGMSLGPLLDFVIDIDPRFSIWNLVSATLLWVGWISTKFGINEDVSEGSIITTAFMGTSVVFVSFSLAALYNTDRKFLYMGGFLLSGLSWLLLAGLLNIFFRSTLIWNVYLYGGLLLFCGFVLYDTQLIVEKRRMGDEDYIWHSVDLFLDFIQIFRKLLIILSNKEKKRKD